MVSEYFYGWYFRCQGEDGTFAVIPAVHISGRKQTCSIQIITETGSWNQEFPICQFRISRPKGIMQIGDNLFSEKGLRLKMEKAQGGVEISGILRFGKLTRPRYDIMGPFRYISGMECTHTVYSMFHSVNGDVVINGKIYHFRNAKGYMEGDSGRSFPEKYVWTQHFLKNGSLMFAAASIPLAGLRFTGTTGILFYKGREYRFATYMGALVRKMGENELLVQQGRYCLEVRFPRQAGEALSAPQKGEMTRRIRENVSHMAEYTLSYQGKTVFRVKTNHAAFEYEIKEEENEDISNHSGENQGKILKRRYHRIQ
ncbi:MAG TPA: tocopherol cyclase family protein [Candidatus Mediterraneibacter pullicola]|uniref:Tocopherol cyclase family protein n=1 Tax=Candidatus Mediterraneibacter pullicola TaxID=2838682 RepID=A0A9D2KK79_9FIRM|nr:tocopherol cyclase family protein [Candidatus Mediterraneibacter pullicola]